VPRQVLDELEIKLQDALQHPTKRNHSLSPREQIKVFLHFLGKECM